MATLSFSIGGPEIDISNKSSKQVLDMVKKEYNKKKEEEKCRFCLVKHDKTFNGGNYICDCDKCGESGCFDCVVGTPSGNLCPSCFVDYNEEEEENNCASCDNILTWEDGEYSGEGHRCSGCYFKEETSVKYCGHKYECGCDKQTCMEMDNEECDDGLCMNEYCKHYYDHRNDNCNCRGTDCPYCNR